MRSEADVQAELDERARHEAERGCGCGYWIASNAEWADISELDGKLRVVSSVERAHLEHPHPKCSCEAARALRLDGGSA